ncbi:hypothetical protein GCM10027418_03310 [Mariniluteicoccus endophyticus]
MRRRPLLWFFLLAYAGSWVLWSPWWLARNGIGLLPWELPRPAVLLVNQLGLFGGPFMAALVVSRVLEGRGARGACSAGAYRAGPGSGRTPSPRSSWRSY